MTTTTQADATTLSAHIHDLARRARERALRPPPPLRTETETHGFFELFADLPLAMRQARSLAHALTQEPALVFPGERIHGIHYSAADPPLSGSPDPWAEFSALPAGGARVAREVPELAALSNEWPSGEPQPGKGSFLIPGGMAPGHIAWNWHWVLELGVEGLMDRHRETLQAASDPAAREYYEAVLVVLQAMLDWNQKHVEALRRLLEAATGAGERAQLEESIAVLERVPARPARSFHEALQSFYFQWLCVMYEVPYGGNSPGRLDYFLWPYLQDELESGELSYQGAAELVAELFIKLDERVHLADGHVNTAVLGGMAPDGSDAVSPLSTIMLDVFEQLDISHPAVYVRVSEANPPQWLERCAEYLLKGRNRAQLLVDEAIIAAMTRGGRMTAQDAAMFMCGGCMEISPHGMNSDLLFSFMYNVPKSLELLITGGECLRTGQHRLDMPGSLASYATYEEFHQAFVGEVRRALHAQFRGLDIYSEELARWRPAFLQSSMISDCLERGRSQQDGGARYADYGGAPVGLQNAADSLTAIKRVIYEDASCTPEELIAALRDDFVGHEALRAKLLGIPKYGMGDPEADAMMDRVVTDVCGVYDEYINRHGGRVKPMIFTFVWAPVMGQSLGASPDGRRSGEPIAHGISPTALGMKEGLTCCMNSVGSLCGDVVSGGATTMWDMDPDWVSQPLLTSVLRTFIQKGGQIFQGNMTSVQDLRRALDKPADYPNLFVRVGGFSARFVSLDRALQQEIIDRHRHRS